ncbi:MAG: sigma-70 family RNA polymerase sigma factor [Verrucomicrobiales bacterium]|nr:sigma-70 family RNA polymerase sigma factor [Verrucomicrobiales bacterium]
MAKTQIEEFVRRLTRGMAAAALADHSDPQLVALALATPGENAFHAIVQRHGPMVYRVCWRILQHAQDTEDAFQATFLVFAQRLRALRKHGSLASWLHGVAHRVALKAKAQCATRRAREHQAAVPDNCPSDDVTWAELREVLDEELSRLPENLRLPLILCYLEGRTQDESARELGWSKITLRRRLDEARELLGCRLKSRDLAWSAALSAALLSDSIASAAPAPGLIASTVGAMSEVVAGKTVTAVASAQIASLVEGVLKTMYLSKLKTAMLMLVCGLLVIGAGLAHLVAGSGAKRPNEAGQGAANQKAEHRPPAQDRNEAEELFRQMEEKLSRTRTLECVFEGKVQPKGSLKGSLAFAEGNKVRVEYSLEIEVDRQVKCTVVSDGAKVVKVLNGKEPEQVFVPSTKDVPLNPQSHREIILKSFTLAGGSTVLELPLDQLKASGFKLGKKEKLDDRDTQIIEYEISLDGVSISTAVWLDAKTILPIKRVASIDKAAGDKYAVTETYTNITLNKNIDAKKFELPKLPSEAGQGGAKQKADAIQPILPAAAEKPVEGPVKPKQEKETFTAWGKELGGLQAGLGYKSGQKRAYRHGETVSVVLRVRNVGKEAVDFKHISAFFVENPPTITDAGGIRPPGSRAEGRHLPHNVKVAPGKEVELYEWKFGLRPIEEGRPSNTWIYGTGKFTLQCERVVGPTGDIPDHPNPALDKLATGKLEIEVKPDAPPASPAKKAGGSKRGTDGPSAAKDKSPEPRQLPRYVELQDPLSRWGGVSGVIKGSDRNLVNLQDNQVFSVTPTTKYLRETGRDPEEATAAILGNGTAVSASGPKDKDGVVVAVFVVAHKFPFPLETSKGPDRLDRMEWGAAAIVEGVEEDRILLERNQYLPISNQTKFFINKRTVLRGVPDHVVLPADRSAVTKGALIEFNLSGLRGVLKGEDPGGVTLTRVTVRQTEN